MLAHRINGSAGRPLVIFLHGFLGSSADWEPVTTPLSSDYCCLAVDLPGHGESSEAPEAAYSFDAVARKIVAIADAVGADRYALVGYSMGGRVALHHAIHHPERIGALVLESCSPGIEDAAERDVRREIDERRATKLEAQGMAPFVHEWYAQPMFATLAAEPEKLSALIATRLQGNPLGLARSLRRMGTGVQEPLWAQLATLTTPTLLIAGAMDGRYTEIANTMSVRSDRIRTSIIQGSGHNVHLEQTAPYVRLLAEFLNLHS